MNDRDRIDKSRNLLGAAEDIMKDNPAITYFLHWFTVPVEVLFHRNFGERWFTTVNFYVGLIVVGVFTTAQETGSVFSKAASGFPGFPGFDQYGQEIVEKAPSFLERLGSHSMVIILLVYVMLSIYHFVMIWWRNRTFTPLHSMYTGDSRFEAVGFFIVNLFDALTVPIADKITQMMPEQERQKAAAVKEPTQDIRVPLSAERFTEVFLEPVILFLLAGYTNGPMRMWLLVSAMATAIFASVKHTGRLNKLLDMQDMTIEAEETSHIKDWLQGGKKGEVPANFDKEKLRILERIKNITERSEGAATAAKDEYPDLMDIIEDMNPGNSSRPTETRVSPREVKKQVAVPLRQAEPSEAKFFSIEDTAPPAPSPVPAPLPPLPREEPAFSDTRQMPPPNMEPVDRHQESPFAKWLSSNSKMLLIAAGSIAGILVVYFIVTAVLKKTQTTPVSEPVKKETPSTRPLNPSPPPLPAKPIPGVIQTETDSPVNLRAEPSEDARTIIQIHAGDQVMIFKYGEDAALKNGEKGKWCRVACKGEIGWVWGKFIKEK